MVLAVGREYCYSRYLFVSTAFDHQKENHMPRTFFHKVLTLLLGLTMIFGGAFPAHAASVFLDPAFGNAGIVTTDFGGFDDLGMDVKLQQDGKILVAGGSFNGIDNDFALTRYNPDGALDLTFGMDGKVTTNFGAGYDFASAVAVQADGRILAAGHAYNGSDDDFALARYHPDGSPDATFGLNGKVTIAISADDDLGSDVILQPDGKIVISGLSYDSPAIDTSFVLARLNQDGSLDGAFGSNGIAAINAGCGSAARALAIQPDGKILVAGDTCTLDARDFAVARFNSDGSPDTTFDGDGFASTSFGNSYDSSSAVALQPDGKIVLAGHSYSDTNGEGFFALARYNGDGSLDTTFDEDGKVTTDLGGWRDVGHALALQPDGRILVAGEQWHEDGTVDFALARYNNNGSLDTDFGSDGAVITDLSPGDYATAIALQSDGRVLVAGFSDNGYNFDFALVRYEVGTSTQEATLDVRPGKFPNRVELEKNVCKDDDNLPVAILTTPEFDALRLVDATSLQMGDPVLGGTAAPIHSQGRDIDRDGDRDVWLLFALCDLVSNNALDENSTELVLTGTTLDGVIFTARDSVEIIRQGPRLNPVPVFVYPVDGQTLDYEGSYLFKVKPIHSAEGFLWGFFQNGVMVWENFRDERVLSGTEYGIHPGTLAHSKFVPGPVEVWVRAWVNGGWTDATVITIHLRLVSGPLNLSFDTGIDSIQAEPQDQDD
jgi:uncharacterized delta-60 repeat protein